MFYVIIGLDPIIYFIILQSFIDCRVKHGNDIFVILTKTNVKFYEENVKRIQGY